ncbi:MAG: hypothetical protein ACD_8C00096G0004 [uncultured bacterium]|nr:MAG: hypothetical protein ACD_8C00096G0004 [uncultured bacterium]
MKIFRKSAYAVSAIALALPMIVSAQFRTPTNTGLPSEGGETTLIDIATGIMNWLLIVVGILGVIGFVIAGILYLTAAGDEGQIEKGKSAMIYSIVGVIVALIGLVIIRAVQGMLGGGEGGF